MPDPARPPAYLIRVDDENDVHVHFTVFAGPLGGTLGNCGRLCMHRTEFDDFMGAWMAVRDGKVRVERRGEPPARSLYSALAEPLFPEEASRVREHIEAGNLDAALALLPRMAEAD